MNRFTAGGGDHHGARRSPAERLVHQVAEREGDRVDEGAHVHGPVGHDADLEAGDVGDHLGADIGPDRGDRDAADRGQDRDRARGCRHDGPPVLVRRVVRYRRLGRWIFARGRTAAMTGSYSGDAEQVDEVQRADLSAARDRIRSAFLNPRDERPPSSARGVHHVALICSDVERTTRFYQEVLGFPLTTMFENRDLPGSTHFFFDLGNGQHHRVLRPARRRPGPLRRGARWPPPPRHLHRGRALAAGPRTPRGRGHPLRPRRRDEHLLPWSRRRTPRAHRRPAPLDVRRARRLTSSRVEPRTTRFAPRGWSAGLAEQDLLGDGRHVDAIGAEHVADAEPSAGQVAVAREVVDVPLVRPRGAMEPDGVVEAR